MRGPFWTPIIPLTGSFFHADPQRKNARSRIAHLFAEMAVRYAQIGLVKNGVYPLTMTQEQIGDAVGLTPVHVNRSLKALREDGVIHVSRRGVQLLDWHGLIHAGEFDPDYLHLPGAHANLDALPIRQVR